MQIPQNADDFYFQCNQFYNCITFQILLDIDPKLKLLPFLQIFHTVIANMDHSFCKHLDYILCQAFFFPRCPEETNEDKKIASYLNARCEQMCWNLLNACSSSFQPVINFIDCSYNRKVSDTNFIHKSVLCNSPPSIPNGHIVIDEHKKTACSIVKYSCDNDCKPDRNNTAVCHYSRHWKSDVISKTISSI